VKITTLRTLPLCKHQHLESRHFSTGQETVCMWSIVVCEIRNQVVTVNDQLSQKLGQSLAKYDVSPEEFLKQQIGSNAAYLFYR
jgi:hypothetical protein